MKNVGMINGSLATFLATDKLKLHGFLVKGSDRKRCIIFIPGMVGTFYSGELAKAIALHAKASGISTFIMNTRGHDIMSSGTLALKKPRRITIGTHMEVFEQSPRDIEGAIKFLKGLGYSEFILAGQSTGCQKELYYAYKRRDRSVKALVLLAPVDDYNLNKAKLGRKWKVLVQKARLMVKHGKARAYVRELPFPPQRFLSVADLGRVESRLFNYDGTLSEFHSVKIPILALFGSREESAFKPVKTYLKLLKQRTVSTNFESVIINGAKHSFGGHEDEASGAIIKWLNKVLQ